MAARILVKQDHATHEFFAPCPRGLAPALAEELTELGAKNAKAADAGVSFGGPFDLIYTANLHSRIASRILWRVAQFPYRKEDDRDTLIRWIEAHADEIANGWRVRMRTEHGTYVKEAIHGEDGQTRPSLSELSGVACRCVELDVTAILDVEGKQEEKRPEARGFGSGVA